MRTFWLLHRDNYNFFTDELEEDLTSECDQSEYENFDPEIFPRPKTICSHRANNNYNKQLSSWSKFAYYKIFFILHIYTKM